VQVKVNCYRLRVARFQAEIVCFRILLPYPSPGVGGSMHKTSAALFFLLQAEVHALLGPPTRCRYIPPS